MLVSPRGTNPGGPPAGDSQKITDETLSAGFTSRGKPKQQRRSNEQHEMSSIQEGAQYRLSASRELRRLIRRLLKSYDENPTAYVDIEHESAVSRYVIQAKLAELNPDDALQMRLVDCLTID